MITSNKTVLEMFKDLCDSAHEAWALRKSIDEQKNLLLSHPQLNDFFCRISIILQDHWILELTKLHDPALDKKSLNLTIDYVVRYGGWDPATKDKLKGLQIKLDKLKSDLLPARNKIICHNDLEALLDGTRLGSFDAGKDESYFNALKEFLELCYEKAGIEPCLFNTHDFFKTDVAILAKIINEAAMR